MVACPRSTLTSSRPCAGCGPPSAHRGHRGHQQRPDQRGNDGKPEQDGPEEQGEAHALLVKVVSDPDWQAARQALDGLVRRLLVVHRLLEAEERLAKRGPPADPR
jgi:hypothetical protein